MKELSVNIASALNKLPVLYVGRIGDPIPATGTMASNQPPIPVLLLKTKSTPGDSYEDIFSKPMPAGHPGFKSHFVPVLQHQFLDNGMLQARDLLQSRKISNGPDCTYGGLIFTSQRAVEAFVKLVEDGKGPYSATDPPRVFIAPIDFLRSNRKALASRTGRIFKTCPCIVSARPQHGHSRLSLNILRCKYSESTLAMARLWHCSYRNIMGTGTAVVPPCRPCSSSWASRGVTLFPRP